MQDTQVWSLGWKDSLEKEMATHSVFLAGKSHGQRSPVGYSPWGCKKSQRWLSDWTTMNLNPYSPWKKITKEKSLNSFKTNKPNIWNIPNNWVVAKIFLENSAIKESKSILISYTIWTKRRLSVSFHSFDILCISISNLSSVSNLICYKELFYSIIWQMSIMNGKWTGIQWTEE